MSDSASKMSVLTLPQTLFWAYAKGEAGSLWQPV